MDKKKQFQIQTVQSKLDNYKQTLQTLLESKNKLSENLALTNPNYDKLDKLNNDKILIENTLKELKTNISNTINNITKLTYSLKDLPSILITKQNNEEEILKQELDRINIQKCENSKTFDESILKAHLDKLKLIDDINIIQNAILEQNDIISQIQSNAHSSRKDTLSLLHQKKQTKLNIKLQQEQVITQDIFFTNQILELQNTVKDLENFKIILVDNLYNNLNSDSYSDSDSYSNIESNNESNSGSNSNSNKKILDNYYSIFDIDINKYIDIDLDNNKKLNVNDIIKIIDIKIATNQNRIQNISIKLNKNKISNDARLNNIIDNYNKTNRVKVIAYKDNFKIEKEKKIQLQLVLDTLTYQYDNFENQIIANIKLDLTNANNELDFDINRANERFVIMKYRTNIEFEMESNRITDEINILNMKIKDMSKSFNNINDELKNLKTIIENENVIGSDIAKLDEEIKKYKAMIIQNETNIILLSQ